MVHKHRTKDEIFVLCLYEDAEKTGNIESPLDRYEVGKHAGLNPKGVNAICKLLIQANFIKKSSETDICLTPHGEKLALRLRSEP